MRVAAAVGFVIAYLTYAVLTVRRGGKAQAEHKLPEKANSFLWIREGKDSLALGNITGALLFQSAIPVALGVALTPWELRPGAMLAATLALGGGVAWLSLHGRARFSSPRSSAGHPS